jgi:Domain of unknown function (DUF5047)
MVGGDRVIPASQKFKETLRTSHTALSRAQVWQPTAQNTYEYQKTLAISAGSLTIDGRRNIRRQGNLTLAPASGFDLSVFDSVSDQCRLVVQRGIKFLDGSEEWVTVATLAVQSAERQLGEGTLKVNGYDPSSCIDDYTLITPYAPIGPDQEPLTTVEAIKDLVDIALWETAVWHVGAGVDTAVKPAAGTVFTGSRWDAINNLAKSLAAQVWVDPLGEWHLELVQTGGWVPVDTFATGEGGVLVDGTSSRDRRDIYNAVPLRWEGPKTGGLVFVVDADPQSPTYWNGPFGRKPSSEQKVDTATTEAQAIDAAKAILAQYKGFTATVRFTSLHNPLIEPGDVLEVIVPDYKLHQLHVVDAITYQLAGGSMTAETRAVQNITTSGLEAVA